MKVKKYTAKTISDAMVKIKDELGQDAVILNSKKVEKGGILGLFTRKNVEVIAAIDPEQKKASGSAGGSSSLQKRKHDNHRPPVQRSSTVNQDTHKLAGEIDELKKMIQSMQYSSTQQNSGGTEDYPGKLAEVNHLLKDQEILDLYRLEIMKKLLKRWYQENGDSQPEREITKWIKNELEQSLIDIPFGGFDYRKKYLNLVGPTGVGKTTTVAKIAAHAVLKDKKKVAFITTDTFRIAAIEQLKTYAKLLHVPVEVAYSIDDFQQAVKTFNDYDFIIIDSAGRNFRNSLYVEQLKQLIDFNEQMETHLVLSATAKYRDMLTIIEQFNLIKIDKLIFSKLDETDSVGFMFNAMKDHQIGASYITTGQNVPDDIEEASREKIISWITRS
ncbi:flagellar biosynthesis protein FlhF [Salisediminibacterium beveridgei]|uniref:Flagellar biosynthesis protein FlhF n=1 Tax=Salisediminibacterium beveridgei TaxID=632773 RepID=A0A1D7QW21_9BACI|nr:flagellar biosynthesis protein FlhF [Salisediminibacterium beveridgei]AOM83169.1 Flagellar biosynthesis protein FlhF [Salisediminibacterium beveridgei]